MTGVKGHFEPDDMELLKEVEEEEVLFSLTSLITILAMCRN